MRKALRQQSLLNWFWRAVAAKWRSLCREVRYVREEAYLPLHLLMVEDVLEHAPKLELESPQAAMLGAWRDLVPAL